jgi:HEAT repeat protein
MNASANSILRHPGSAHYKPARIRKGIPAKRSISRWVAASVGLLAAFALLATTSRGMIIISDDSEITDPQQRAELTVAVETLRTNTSDLPSLEVILKTFPDVASSVGTSLILQMKDPLKAQACNQLKDLYSIDVLAQALTKGSDLAAQWASIKIVVQRINSNNPDLKARGGIIDAAACEKLQGLLLEVIKRKDPAARAATVNALSSVFPKDALPKLIKPLLQDTNAPVIAAAIRQLGGISYYDKEVDAAVQKAMTDSQDPGVLVASCMWWWLARGHNEKSITPDQEALMVRRSADPHPEVRWEVAKADNEYATPEHPVLINMLLSLADNDGDEIARMYAVGSLGHAKTKAVHARLIDFAQNAKSALVRQAAQHLLDLYNWNYPWVKE